MLRSLPFGQNSRTDGFGFDPIPKRILPGVTMAARRRFLMTMGALVAARLARAQAVEGPIRVGFLYLGTRRTALESGRYQALLDGLRELGWVEGRNLVMDARFAESESERLPALVAELAAARPAAIVATGSPAYKALSQATKTVPVVVTVTVDPVVAGLAKTLARPGGNFTGLTDTAALLGPKHVELLDAAVPRLARVAVLLNPENASHESQFATIDAAAGRLGKQATALTARNPSQLETAFATAASRRAGALIVLGDTFFTDQLRHIADRALAAQLPAAHFLRAFAEAGGLLSYGHDVTGNFRRAARFVDKIAKGAKPGDLPFEQPTQYELVINLRTARALGLSLPQSLLLRADAVVQ
jgi:putative tryptophan/tyrosine transport system substrate-binding protein